MSISQLRATDKIHDGQLLGERFILARDFRGLHVPGFGLAVLDQGQFTVAGACTWQR